MNEITISGTQNFMGVEIPIIEGGFSEGQKVILAKTIAEIHGVELKEVNRLINNHLDEFEFGIDLLDLKNGDYKTPLNILGFSNRDISISKNIYLLSEQGYMLLISFMKTEKAKEVRKQLRRDYFSMREIVNSKEKLLAETFYKSIFSETEQDRVINTKLFGELKENFGMEKQKEIDKIELENERVENYLSTIDLVKQLPSKRLFSKFLFEALEMKGYGENKLVNKYTRFIHNEKFENEFIKTGLCRASATNMYTWSPKMIDYIVEGDMLKLMQQISKIVNRTTEQNQRRKTNEGYTYKQVLKILNNTNNINIDLEYLMNKLIKLNWIDKNEKETQYARDNNYMYRYYKYSKITDDGLEELLNILK